MNITGKSSPEQANFARKKIYRNLLKKKISSDLQNDLLTDYVNPFLQQLTPWNEGASKLQASTNLLKQQAESKNIFKNFAQAQIIQLPAQSIAERQSQNYSSLAWPFLLQQKKISQRYAYPRLKISSQQVIVSKNKKDEAKRLLFHKKSIIQNKKTKKIANLTIQWDQDIIYNPQKKYFQEQTLKRKILRQFAQIKNENRQLNSRKQVKNEDKMLKIQFKKNKIQKKQVTIYQFKKNQNFQNQSKEFKERNQQSPDNLAVLKQKQQKKGQIKVSNLSFEPLHQRPYSPQILSCDQSQRISPDKWRFRSSLKVKRNLSIQKNDFKNQSKTEFIDKNPLTGFQIVKVNDALALNRITIGVNQRIHENRMALQLLARTTPNFFKKKSD